MSQAETDSVYGEDTTFLLNGWMYGVCSVITWVLPKMSVIYHSAALYLMIAKRTETLW